MMSAYSQPSIFDGQVARRIARLLIESGAVVISPSETFSTASASRRLPGIKVLVENLFYPDFGAFQTVCQTFDVYIRTHLQSSSSMAQKVNPTNFDVVGCVQSGGTYIGVALRGMLDDMPRVLVEKDGAISGDGSLAGQRVILIEDVVTTGGSCMRAIEAVRKAGGTVTAVVAMVEYGILGVRDRFTKLGAPLRVLTTMNVHVLQEALRLGKMHEGHAEEILAWIDAEGVDLSS